MRKFIFLFFLTISLLGFGQKLDNPIVIQSTTMYIVDLESLSQPITTTKFSPNNQDMIIFDGEKISETSIVNSENISIFDFTVESYQSFKSSDEPSLMFYSIIPSKESSNDIMRLTVDTNTGKCQFKTFRMDDSTEDIWSVIVVEGNLK